MKTLSILAAMLFSSSLIFAQSGEQPQRPDHSIINFAEEIGLTDEQVKAIETIQATSKGKLEQLRDQNLESRATRAQRVELVRTHRAQIKAILTPEQQEQYQSLHQKHRQAHKAAWENVDFEGMHRALKGYREVNILPVIKTARTELDREINATDQAEIARLRAVMTTRPKPTRNPQMRKEKPDRAAMREQRTQMQEARKEWRDAHADDLKALRQLTEKYGPAIDAQLAKLAQDHEQWEADMITIKENFLPESVHGKAPHGHRARKMARHSHRGAAEEGEMKERAEKKEARKRSLFLLMDPDKPTFGEEIEATPLGVASTTMQLAPNPLRGQGTITLEVKEAGTIKLDLVEENGRLVRTLTNKYFTAGAHQLVLDASDLNNRNYLLSLEDAAGRRTMTFIVNR